MIKYLALPFSIVLFACGGNEVGEDSVDTFNENDTLNSVDTVSNKIETKPYQEDLNKKMDIDLTVVYETWAEGDYMPLTVVKPDGTSESYEMANPYAHFCQYDGTGYDSTNQKRQGIWYIDGLWEEYGGDSVVFEKGTTIDGGWMRTAVEADIYAEPDENSKIVHSWGSETWTDIIAYWNGWARVSYYTSEKNKLGWVKTRPLDEFNTRCKK